MTQAALNRHQRRRQRTQKQLEQATYELLIDKGFEALTINDIAETADLGRGTFYLHFQDKEQAVWTLTERVLSEGDSISSLANASPPATVNLIDGVAHFFQHAEQHRELFTMLLGARGSPVVADRLREWLTRRFLPIFRQYRSFLIHPQLPEELQVILLTGSLLHLLHWWLQQEQAPPARQAAGLVLSPYFSVESPRP
jgi:AcrR family transcriptional regulator